VHFLMKIGASEADARDAAQEAMVDLLYRLRTDPEAVRRPRSYVYKSGKHCFYRLSRLARREDLTAVTTRAPALGGSDGAVLTEEEAQRVLDLLDRLPPAQKEVVALHYDGFTHSEISDIVGKPDGTVRSLLRHGKNRLREVIQTE
jgi:RNA polymerase sigma-70 factor (ECF subfamily)